MFRFVPARLDQLIDRALNAAAGREDVDVPYPDSAGPGFRLGEIFEESTGPLYGPRAKALDGFVYALFVRGAPPAQGGAAVPSKPVRFAQGRRLYDTRPAFLAVGVAPHTVLVPLPAFAEALLEGPRFETVGDARAALHEAARDCIDRANLVWPAAVALMHDSGDV